ncbi:MAG TPA: hypothetical protein VGN38_08740 [Caulobacteraceae bacterium]|jgi:hypothetical protein|nr:hypothetical protein [Caulobacteraceae bacterium]
MDPTPNSRHAFYFLFERRTPALRRWLIARLGESPRAADTRAAIGGGA